MKMCTTTSVLYRCDVVLMSTSNSVGTVKLHGEWARMDSAYENDVHEIEGVEGKHRPIQSLDIFSSNCKTRLRRKPHLILFLAACSHGRCLRNCYSHAFGRVLCVELIYLN